jgi:hypothetical protein
MAPVLIEISFARNISNRVPPAKLIPACAVLHLVHLTSATVWATQRRRFLVESFTTEASEDADGERGLEPASDPVTHFAWRSAKLPT